LNSGLLGKDLFPRVLGAAENGTRKPPIFILRRVCICRAGLLDLRFRWQILEQLPRVAAAQVNGQSKNKYAYSSAAYRQSTANTATVLDIRTLP
jgi:hypothetical protein